MSPQELDAVCFFAEQLAKYAYQRGHADGLSKTKPNHEQFKMTRSSKLTMKVNLEKLAKPR